MLHDRNGLADGAFDVFQQGALIAGTECNRHTFSASARGAADAVDVGFGHMGQVVIDDVAYAINVNAARRDVGCDQHQNLASLESGKRLFAVGLALVAVNGGGGVTRSRSGPS